ncbi:MAG: DUF302 domain-containing protein [Frankiales bacterium]|nr:DUF302 domain-containing protein [Frankiales bacterium]
MSHLLSITVARAFDPALRATREALAENGFGILTEIDLQATLKAKLDVDLDPQNILGVCRPTLAHAALTVEPAAGVLLPCTVVVRYRDNASTTVDVLDPQAMVTVTGNEALTPIAAEAAARLSAALVQLAGLAPM